jgi:hypothetical protein
MNPRCEYRFNYEQIFRDIANGKLEPEATFRKLILEDLFFNVQFVLNIDPNVAPVNTPFVVNACREVEEGPATNTFDVWAREHFKSTVITVAETIQFHLKYPDLCTGIFSYVRPVAKGFLRSIKQVYEDNIMLKKCFPEIMWGNPQSESPKWSEDDGLVLRRSGYRKESTVEAWGLVEGMPTSKHFDRRIYDDCETDDLIENVDMMRKVKHKFDVSQYLGTLVGTHRVIGTYYHHAGPMVYIENKKTPDGAHIYHVRKKPGTVDGTYDGQPVLVSRERQLTLMSDTKTYNTQFLLNPTPDEAVKLHYNFLRCIREEDVPPNILKFMILDPAGDDTEHKSTGDAWSFGVCGVEPCVDEIGASNIYLLDLEAGPMSETEAIEKICRMYLRNGIIQQLGVEKTGQSAAEGHIASALRVHGRFLSVEDETMVILKPANRNKMKRIETALSWPLNNGKWHYLNTIRPDLLEMIQDEMTKFPFFHVDIIDMLAYLYDMLGPFKWAKHMPTHDIDMSGVFRR